MMLPAVAFTQSAPLCTWLDRPQGPACPANQNAAAAAVVGPHMAQVPGTAGSPHQDG
jgi:hypothetical protein